MGQEGKYEQDRLELETLLVKWTNMCLNNFSIGLETHNIGVNMWKYAVDRNSMVLYTVGYDSSHLAPATGNAQYFLYNSVSSKIYKISDYMSQKFLKFFFDNQLIKRCLILAEEDFTTVNV